MFKKIKKMFKKSDMVIGTLIIFIAMILVAAIAAGVLITTAGSLQNKALLTGERSKSQVSTSVETILLFAEDASSDQTIENFSQKMKLSPGSDPIKFEEAIIEFDLKDTSADINYSGAVSTCSNFSTSTFSVEYIQRGSKYKAGYLQRGDVVKLCYGPPRAVNEDEDIRIAFTPKSGNANEIRTSTPNVMTTTEVILFP